MAYRLNCHNAHVTQKECFAMLDDTNVKERVTTSNRSRKCPYEDANGRNNKEHDVFYVPAQ
jgi:hypothetical protein